MLSLYRAGRGPSSSGSSSSSGSDRGPAPRRSSLPSSVIHLPAAASEGLLASEFKPVSSAALLTAAAAGDGGRSCGSFGQLFYLETDLDSCGECNETRARCRVLEASLGRAEAALLIRDQRLQVVRTNRRTVWQPQKSVFRWIFMIF